VTIDAPVAAMTLPGETSIVLFRILQEALTNAIRHAGASQITVRVLLDEDALIVGVADDGKGLKASHVFNGVSWGIAGMQSAHAMSAGDQDHGYHRMRYGRRFCACLWKASMTNVSRYRVRERERLRLERHDLDGQREQREGLRSRHSIRWNFCERLFGIRPEWANRPRKEERLRPRTVAFLDCGNV
jgi:hypothetical protein